MSDFKLQWINRMRTTRIIIKISHGTSVFFLNYKKAPLGFCVPLGKDYALILCWCTAQHNRDCTITRVPRYCG